MTDKTFQRMVLGVLLLCAAATLLHIAYIFFAYQHCSIVQFIARELW